MTATPKSAPARRRHGKRTEAQPDVHIINPLWDASGGSEWSAIDLYRELEGTGRCRPRLWSEFKIDPFFARNFPVRRIRFPFRYPRTGNIIFVGVYFGIGRWFDWSRPARTIVRYNTPEIDTLQFRMKRLSVNGSSWCTRPIWPPMRRACRDWWTTCPWIRTGSSRAREPPSAARSSSSSGD